MDWRDEHRERVADIRQRQREKLMTMPTETPTAATPATPPPAETADEQADRADQERTEQDDALADVEVEVLAVDTDASAHMLTDGFAAMLVHQLQRMAQAAERTGRTASWSPRIRLVPNREIKGESQVTLMAGDVKLPAGQSKSYKARYADGQLSLLSSED